MGSKYNFQKILKYLENWIANFKKRGALFKIICQGEQPESAMWHLLANPPLSLPPTYLLSLPLLRHWLVHGLTAAD